MDRNNKHIGKVEYLHRKAKNGINQGFFKALTAIAAVDSPLLRFTRSAQKWGFQKGTQHPVHSSGKLLQAKKEGLTSTEPFLALVYQTTLERRTHRNYI